MVLQRLIGLATPESIPPSPNASVWRTRWSWVGLKALAIQGESLQEIETAARILVDERLLLIRTRSAGKVQITLA
jgi:hypothetical protein